MTYSILILLRSDDASSIQDNNDTTMVNQAGFKVKKVTMKRLRAIELLKLELKTLAKYGDLGTLNLMSKVLRKQVIATMLFMIE
jgi:hypothetical protein